MQRRLLTAALVAAFASLPALAQQPAWPARPITIVVPASPGGAIDLLARLIGNKMTADWGQPVVIDNRTGATGIIGTDLVAKAQPDGYNLVLVASSHAINPSMVRKLPFDTVKSFEPVALTHVVPLVLVTSPAFPAKTVQDIVAYGKAHPGELSFASSGSGGAPHFSGELFKSLTGIQMTHIPYKGSTLAHPDLMSGRVSLMFDTVAATNAQIKAGKLKAYAVTTSSRAASLPDVPTMQEAGIAGYETSTWGGLLAPAGTPKAVVDKINAEVNRVLALPDVKKTLQDNGIEAGGGSPAQFGSFIQAEMVKWGKVAKDAGIQPE
ncbi:tripartite tricarboxylate transporter substrate binding protein [Xylophilus rhododendri]|uniref:Tripartite tricarboxylate transporter substrate binding protein n=1 Tax=Xylophilus rhododendri TaxID=2697032 RepID=A0A857J8D0_9BURK|nr:tripartite tricarboxylate transporter substrate binding protein [Xylophilus rhododendri]QHI99272.1 tripartite tricarboxylate transporter substrate binding protein [Xylophilus rhododendri]